MRLFGMQITRGAASPAPVPAAAPRRTDPPLTRPGPSAMSGTAKPERWLTEIGWSGGGRAINGTVSPARAERHATVFACCAGISGDLAKVPLKVQRRVGNGVEERVRDHPLEYLLNRDAGNGVPARLVRMNLAYAWLLRGNGYAYAPRDGAGEVEFIEIVEGHNPAILKSGRNRFYDFVDGAAVNRRAPARSMVHARYLPKDGWEGRSPLQVAGESMALAMARQDAASRTARGGVAKAAIHLSVDFEDDVQRARTARRIKAALIDPEADGFPVLSPEEKITPLDLSAADIQLLESQRFDREQIAAVYRMPPFKLQILEGGVRANSEQQSLDYLTDCLSFWGGLFEAQLEMALLTEDERRAGLFLRHDFGALLAPSIRDRNDAIARAVGGPFMTPDEGRAIVGLPPVPGGDRLNPAPNMTRDDSAQDTEGDDE